MPLFYPGPEIRLLKKLHSPKAQREALIVIMARFGLSIRRACSLLGVNHSSYQYKAKEKDDQPIKNRLKELAEARRRFGCPRLHVMLRREGFLVNHKRTERIYRETGLTLAKRKRFRKRVGVQRQLLERPSLPNQRWSMDFVADRLWDGRKLKVLTIVDDYSRECPAMEVDTSINGVRVTHVLEMIGQRRGFPKILVVDNGPEFAGKTLDEWAYRKGITLHFIRPGKPVENCYVESFNGKFRDECLNEHWFVNLSHAREKLEEWRIDYNYQRPHKSLNYSTPDEFIKTQEIKKLNLRVV